MKAKLYSLTLSHPARAARLMLEPKGIDRPCAELAMRLFPSYPSPIPLRLPPAWLPAR